MLSIGDSVLLPQGQTGVLRWTGRIHEKPIEYAGVELTGPYAQDGKHSGEFGGHKYFETEVPGAGLFVSYSKLVSANVHTPIAQLDTGRVPAFTQSSSPSREGSVRSASRASRQGFRPRQDLFLASPQLDSPPDKEPHGSVGYHKLRRQLEEKDAKIAQLKLALDDKRQEFRTVIKNLEDDRDSIADHYEGLVGELTSQLEQKSRNGAESTTEIAGELEIQRAALAAMQNKLMEEHDQMNERVAAARREANEAKEEADRLRKLDGHDQLALMMKDLQDQEDRLAELQSCAEEIDDLKQENAKLRERCASHDSLTKTSETQLQELETLRQQVLELEVALPPPTQKVPDTSIHAAIETDVAVQQQREQDLRAQLSEKMMQVESLLGELEAAKATGNGQSKLAAENESLRKELATMRRSEMEIRHELEQARERMAQLELDREDATRALEERVLSDAELNHTELSGEAAGEGSLAPNGGSSNQRASRDTGSLDFPVPHAPKGAKTEVASSAAKATDVGPVPDVDKAIDLAAGRELWCGLCERSGHTAVDCPFED